MKVWIDAQLSPKITRWIGKTFDVEASSMRELGYLRADDAVIFRAARRAAAIVMTKDGDFVDLLDRLGPPPQVIWITCGNTTNDRLRSVLARSLPDALRLISAGEVLVEITG